jgi:hypothetical protein
VFNTFQRASCRLLFKAKSKAAFQNSDIFFSTKKTRNEAVFFFKKTRNMLFKKKKRTRLRFFFKKSRIDAAFQKKPRNDAFEKKTRTEAALKKRVQRLLLNFVFRMLLFCDFGPVLGLGGSQISHNKECSLQC